MLGLCSYKFNSTITKDQNWLVFYLEPDSGQSICMPDVRMSNSGSLPTISRTNALAFLNKGNMHQVLRKEIMFGLLPTTLTGIRLTLSED